MSLILLFNQPTGGGTTWTLNLSDTLTLSDIISKNVGLNKADTLTLSDIISKNVGLNKADTLVLSDIITLSIYFGILKRWDGAIWKKAKLETYLALIWQLKPLKRWDGANWKLVDTSG